MRSIDQMRQELEQLSAPNRIQPQQTEADKGRERIMRILDEICNAPPAPDSTKVCGNCYFRQPENSETCGLCHQQPEWLRVHPNDSDGRATELAMFARIASGYSMEQLQIAATSGWANTPERIAFIARIIQLRTAEGENVSR